MATGSDPESLQDVTVLRYRPGRQCTLRLTFSDPASRRVYAKIYREHIARRVARALEELGKLGPWPELEIPRVLLYEPEEGVVLLEEVKGTSLEERMESGADPGGSSRLAGLAVARLHSLDPPDLRRWSVDEELATLVEHRQGLQTRAGVTAGRAEHALARAEELAARLRSVPPVVLHRGLDQQRILLQDDRAGLVNMDDVAVGAAEIDLGSLLAHLEVAGLYRHGDPERYTKAEWELLQAYRSAQPFYRDALEAARGLALLRYAAVNADNQQIEGELVRRLFARAEIVMERELRG
jgi:hypothetical protein